MLPDTSWGSLRVQLTDERRDGGDGVQGCSGTGLIALRILPISAFPPATDGCQCGKRWESCYISHTHTFMLAALIGSSFMKTGVCET